jgi:peptidyl-prolyl cis-trans isomerase C
MIVAASLACRKAPAAAPEATAAAAPAAAHQAAPASTPAAAQTPQGTPPAAPAAKPVPQQLPAIIAKVNGDAISRDEFEDAVHSLEARNGGPVPTDRRDEILRGVLDQLVTYHLLEQEAVAKKVVVPDTELNNHLDQIKKQFPDEAAFQKALAAQGTSEPKLKENIKTSLMVTEVLQEEVGPKVAVTDKDVSDFYAANQASFAEGEAVRASHILIAVPKNATAEQKAAAKTKAEGLLKQIKGGADFATLAKANSDDPGSAARGGDLGFFEKGQMVPSFDQAAFALKPGQISDLVESPFGYHIIKVTDRRPPRTPPLAEVSADIKNFLTNQARQKETTKLVAQLREKSKIEIFI